jgi:hypothetical protein
MGYMEAIESLKYPFLTTRVKGGFGSLQVFSIRRMPGDRNLLSLDASLAIPTCVLGFEDSGLRRRTPVRPVWHCSSTVFGSSVLALWINQGT